VKAGGAALLLWLCALGGCLDQPLVVSELRASEDDDDSDDAQAEEPLPEAGTWRRDAGLARCQACPFIVEPRSCYTPGFTLAFPGCFECNCCDDDDDCQRNGRRDYSCQRNKAPIGQCVDGDMKRPNDPFGPP